jgi:anti-sigma factor RsiW
MTDDPLESPARELLWRHKLTESQEAQLRSWLASHPEAQAEFGSETALNELLEALPDAPVATNFTARVLQAAEAQAVPSERTPNRPGTFLRSALRWLPRTALAALTFGVGLIYYEHFREAHRIQMARDAAVISEVASLPGPKVLQDFEVIRAVSQPAAADVELLKLLQ